MIIKQKPEGIIGATPVTSLNLPFPLPLGQNLLIKITTIVT